jgi:hypothetical protein
VGFRYSTLRLAAIAATIFRYSIRRDFLQFVKIDIRVAALAALAAPPHDFRREDIRLDIRFAALAALAAPPHDFRREDIR